MKQTMVQIKFDAERYAALQRYADRKKISVEQELLDCVERLYKKLVPPDVRDYIESKSENSNEKNRARNREIHRITPALQSESAGDAEQSETENDSENTLTERL